jgi:hypothetical protein
MPKITRGGVSNTVVDPDYIAPPGTPPEVGIITGAPNAGQPSKEQPETFPGKSLYDDENDPNRPTDAPERNPERERGERPSHGNSSPDSPEKQNETTSGPKNEKRTRSTARTTDGHSTEGRTGNSTASSADTSSTRSK